MRLATVLFPVLLAAQGPGPLTFEVASVKRAAPDARTTTEVTNGGGLNATTSLDFLLFVAYKVKDFQVVNMPGWARSELYTIVAKPPAGYAPKQPGKADDDLRRRIESLLADRFRLSVRREMREQSVYALTVAKNGPNLPPPPHGETFKLRTGRGKIANDGGAAIPMLVSLLANHLDRAVFDETGLTGRYKFDLTWTPDPRPGDAPANAAGPSLFTALQEQLGLKLESRRRPVETIVIEHVERPTEN